MGILPTELAELIEGGEESAGAGMETAASVVPCPATPPVVPVSDSQHRGHVTEPAANPATSGDSDLSGLLNLLQRAEVALFSGDGEAPKTVDVSLGQVVGGELAASAISVRPVEAEGPQPSVAAAAAGGTSPQQFQQLVGMLEQQQSMIAGLVQANKHQQQQLNALSQSVNKVPALPRDLLQQLATANQRQLAASQAHTKEAFKALVSIENEKHKRLLTRISETLHVVRLIRLPHCCTEDQVVVCRSP